MRQLEDADALFGGETSLLDLHHAAPAGADDVSAPPPPADELPPAPPAAAPPASPTDLLADLENELDFVAPAAAGGDAAAAPAGDDAFDLDDFESYLDTLGTGSK